MSRIIRSYIVDIVETDDVIYCDKDGHLTYNIEADRNELVRCKDCRWYEPAHILHDDGSKTYVDENAPWVTADVGINVGGQCIDHSELKISCVNHNREDPEDYEEIVIFRRPNDYCSCGERRE